MEFTPFPKVPRLSREMVITEKLDGTNASVWVQEVQHQGQFEAEYGVPIDYAVYPSEQEPGLQGLWAIRAGSRKRFITPEDDNFGFAAWVRDNAHELVKLGPGVHYGEWWGKGIQRGYGLDEKRFSLFNVGRWRDGHGPCPVCQGDCSSANPPQTYCPMRGDDGFEFAPGCCHVVPVLYRGMFEDTGIRHHHAWTGALEDLLEHGSVAAPGYMNPEGIMIYNTAARQYFKKTFEGDEAGKGAS